MENMFQITYYFFAPVGAEGHIQSQLVYNEMFLQANLTQSMYNKQLTQILTNLSFTTNFQFMRHSEVECNPMAVCSS